MVRVWRWMAAGGVLSVAVTAWGAGVGAADMEGANGAAAVTIRDAVLKGEPTTPVERDDYAQRMVKEFDAGVRLWGAKGLGAIAPTLTKVGGSSREDAVKALKEAEGVESSEV